MHPFLHKCMFLHKSLTVPTRMLETSLLSFFALKFCDAFDLKSSDFPTQVYFFVVSTGFISIFCVVWQGSAYF